jgi:hypothetical protein
MEVIENGLNTVLYTVLYGNIMLCTRKWFNTEFYTNELRDLNEYYEAHDLLPFGFHETSLII